MNALSQHTGVRTVLPLVLLAGLALTAFSLWQQQGPLSKTLYASQQELAQISVLSQEYKALGGLSATKQQFNHIDQALQWLIISSKQQGIEVQITPLDSEQPQLRIRIDRAHFNRLMQWLQLQNDTNLVLVSSQLSAEETGMASGLMLFEVR